MRSQIRFHSSSEKAARQFPIQRVTTKEGPSSSLIFAGKFMRPLLSRLWLYSPYSIPCPLVEKPVKGVENYPL